MKIAMRIEIEGDDEWTDIDLSGQTCKEIIEVTKNFGDDIAKEDAISLMMQTIICKLEVPRKFCLLANLVNDCQDIDGESAIPAEDELLNAAGKIITYWRDFDASIATRARGTK